MAADFQEETDAVTSIRPRFESPRTSPAAFYLLAKNKTKQKVN